MSVEHLWETIQKLRDGTVYICQKPHNFFKHLLKYRGTQSRNHTWLPVTLTEINRLQLRVMIKQRLFSPKVISLLLQLKVTYPTLEFPSDTFRSDQALKVQNECLWFYHWHVTLRASVSAFQPWKKLALTPFMDLMFFPLLREVGFIEQQCPVHVYLSISLTMFNCLINYLFSYF